MHTFQPYPVDLLDWNPMEKISKEWFALTTEFDGKANAMTCSWGGIGHLWNKNVAFVFVRESRYTKELLDNSDTFSACFFDPKDKANRQILKYFGAVSGRVEDKIAAAKLNVNHCGEIPFIDEANFAIVCKKLAAVPITKESLIAFNLEEDFYKEGDYHTMYIGEIVDILAR